MELNIKTQQTGSTQEKSETYKPEGNIQNGSGTNYTAAFICRMFWNISI